MKAAEEENLKLDLPNSVIHKSKEEMLNRKKRRFDELKLYEEIEDEHEKEEDRKALRKELEREKELKKNKHHDNDPQYLKKKEDEEYRKKQRKQGRLTNVEGINVLTSRFF